MGGKTCRLLNGSGDLDDGSSAGDSDCDCDKRSVVSCESTDKGVDTSCRLLVDDGCGGAVEDCEPEDCEYGCDCEGWGGAAEDSDCETCERSGGVDKRSVVR